MGGVRAPARRATWHDAFDRQMGLWRWYRTPEGKAHIAAAYKANRAGLSLPETRELIDRLYGAELSRLLDLDPIFVSAEMCDVIEAAAESFAPEPLLDTDLLTPRGFLYYERPFQILDRFDEPTDIRAASYTRLWSTPDEERQIEANRMALEQWETAGDLATFEERVAAEAGLTPRGLALTLYGTRDREPWVAPIHVTPWYFDMTFEGNEIDEHGISTGAGWWWRLIQTTYRLMAQQISAKSIHRPDRPARREWARLSELDHEPEIVVVRLRREKGETAEPSGETANYSHRFIVSGHWRNQPYPSEGITRQIWISPYVKGDPGLPLVVRPRRVFAWSR